jgi:hypothetical protein
MEKLNLIRKVLVVTLCLDRSGRSIGIKELQFYFRASFHFLVLEKPYQD